MRREYTTTDLATIREMAGRHHPQEIADLLGRSKKSILSVASRHCIDIRQGKIKRRYITDARCVAALREQGKLYREIAQITGIPESTCCRLSRRFNGK